MKIYFKGLDHLCVPSKNRKSIFVRENIPLYQNNLFCFCPILSMIWYGLEPAKDEKQIFFPVGKTQCINSISFGWHFLLYVFTLLLTYIIIIWRRKNNKSLWPWQLRPVVQKCYFSPTDDFLYLNILLCEILGLSEVRATKRLFLVINLFTLTLLTLTLATVTKIPEWGCRRVPKFCMGS